MGVLADGSAVPSATPLPEHLVRLLRRATADVSPDVAGAVDAQAARAVVVAHVEGRSVDVAVPDDVPPVPAADGPLRPVVSVVDATGEATGELLVWVRGGRLVGLERPWWTDEPPTSWPGPDDLRRDGTG